MYAPISMHMYECILHMVLSGTPLSICAYMHMQKAYHMYACSCGQLVPQSTVSTCILYTKVFNLSLACTCICVDMYMLSMDLCH